MYHLMSRQRCVELCSVAVLPCLLLFGQPGYGETSVSEKPAGASMMPRAEDHSTMSSMAKDEKPAGEHAKGMMMDHKMGDMAVDKEGMASAGHHAHRLDDISAWTHQPRVSLRVYEDAIDGWNIHITTERFQLKPEKINSDPVEGEGHAHLYIDEQKVARLYGNWYHVPALTPGRHSIKVQLNGHDHATLANGKNPIEIITIVTQR